MPFKNIYYLVGGVQVSNALDFHLTITIFLFSFN